MGKLETDWPACSQHNGLGWACWDITPDSLGMA